MAKLEDISTPSLTYDEGAAPATPASGKVVIYAKSDGLLYSKDDAGTETLVSGAGDASPLTTKGDVFGYGSADARLPVGTNGQVLTADSGQTLGIKWAKPTRGICFSINNVDLAITQSVAITAPCALTVTGGKIEVGTAPTGAALICDVHKNGTTLWTTQGNRPTIADAGTNAAITVPDVTALAQGDRLLLMIDQVGSTVAGKDLSLTLYCEVA